MSRLIVTGIGFIADFNKDGFSTGSPKAYSGDYFLPGSPLEGWSVEYKIGSGGNNVKINKGMVGKHQIPTTTIEGAVPRLFFCECHASCASTHALCSHSMILTLRVTARYYCRLSFCHAQTHPMKASCPLCGLAKPHP